MRNFQHSIQALTFLCKYTYSPLGPGSSVGIATGYGLDGSGIESQWGEIFRTCSDRPWAHPASCTMGTGVFPEVKSGRGETLTTHSLLVPWSKKGRAIPLLPLWAVRPVQSFSACARVQFTFTLPTVLKLWHLMVLFCWRHGLTMA